MTWLTRLIDWCVARTPGDSLSRMRGWYAAAMWCAAAPLLVVTAISHAAQGLAWKAATDTAALVFAGSALVALRRGRSPRAVAHASFAFVLLYICVGTVLLAPFEPLGLIYVVFVPQLATIALGPRAAVGWGVAAFAAGAATLWGGQSGAWLVLTERVPEPRIELVVNFFIATVVASVAALLHDRARQKAYDELSAYEASRSRLLAHVSHELRTPLNGIVGMAEVLPAATTAAAQREALDVITGQAASLRRVVDDFLDFSKLGAGKLVLSEAPTSVRALVEPLAAMHRAAATKKGVSLGHHVSRTVPAWLALDALRVQQVLNNLVGNAVKFTSAGSVHIDVWHDAGALLLTIDDTGAGMSEALKARLFRPFEQARAHEGGTGLGLAITKQLVEAMGGRVDVESEEGHGSRFTVRLPTREVLAPVATAEPVALAPRALKVLVVDDNAVNRLVATRLLALMGHHAAQAEDGSSALSLMGSGGFDAVLMDFHMPGLDGPETTRRHRQVEVGPRLPIFAVTASSLKEELDACLEAGMDGALLKPLARGDLERALAQCGPARSVEQPQHQLA